ncbi:hypothetical protein [Agathobaculum sp.]|uniref:hypothetical protein n=1 Tax=Agathobaculum sp. TaxID=2048138 RepID=UPI002A80F777|nr:hypothetical protein [Agathobaculum sp.]MDY3619295.1 hypothetical protein [Agathobaculum sp.]
MRKFASTAIIAAVLVGALAVPAGAHHNGGHRRAAQCSTSACMVNGVCDGSCTGTGSCSSYSGCNATQHYQHHQSRGHRGCR